VVLQSIPSAISTNLLDHFAVITAQCRQNVQSRLDIPTPKLLRPKLRLRMNRLKGLKSVVGAFLGEMSQFSS
jgi:hypothetical protein